MQTVAGLTAVSPITGNTDSLTQFLADPVELKFLHMITGDPQRTPTFVMFGNPDYFFQTFGTPTLNESNGFAWNHGGTSPEVVTTWLGLVGPGVQQQGVDHDTWSDHTDIRPTMLALAGLTEDYAHDGRVLVEALDKKAVPTEIRPDTFVKLAVAYKQIMAAVSDLGYASLSLSTTALAGDDATYARIEAQLASFTTQRDAIGAQMIQMLENAEFNGQKIDEPTAHQLIAQASALLQQVEQAAGQN